MCIGVIFAIAASSTLGQSHPVSLNLAESYADTKAAMLAGDADLVCIGDSLTFRNDSYVPTLRARLQAMHGDGGQGWMALPNFPRSNERGFWYSPPGSADVAPYRGLNGVFLMAASALPVTLDQRSWNTRYSLYYMSRPAGPILHVDTPGFARVSVDTWEEPGNVVRRVDGSSLNFAPLTFTLERSGSLILLGLNCTRPQPGVRLHVAANGGFGVDNYLWRDASYDQILTDLDPDMYLIMLGQNDAEMDYATFKTKLSGVVDRVLAATPDAEIVLIGTYNSGLIGLEPRITAQHDLALERGLGFIDLYHTAGDLNYFSQNGYLHPDGIHWTFAGGAYVGNIVFDALETDGASLVSGCGDLDFNNDGAFPDDRDLIDLLAAIAGGGCSTGNCDRIDFVRDGLFPSDEDLVGYLTVLAGGACPI